MMEFQFRPTSVPRSRATSGIGKKKCKMYTNRYLTALSLISHKRLIQNGKRHYTVNTIIDLLMSPTPFLAADNKAVEDVLVGNLSAHHSPLSRTIRLYVSSEWAGTDCLLRYSVATWHIYWATAWVLQYNNILSVISHRRVVLRIIILDHMYMLCVYTRMQ